jgi:hypothetical protein
MIRTDSAGLQLQAICSIPYPNANFKSTSDPEASPPRSNS